MNDGQSRLGPLIVFKRISLNDPASKKLLQRLEHYAKLYASYSFLKKDKLTVQGIRFFPDGIDESDYRNLSILYSGKNIFSEIVEVVSYFRKKNGYPNVIIAGDPWIGFLKSYLLKRIYFKNSKIQIQIHGDIYSAPKLWNVKEVVKFGIVRLSLNSAQSIRVVSEFQIKYLKPHVQKNSTFVCAPIPIDLDKIPLTRNINRAGIGLVGRLHKERGLDFFLSILEEMKFRKIKAQIFIVGDGPRKKALARRIKHLGLIENVCFTGELSNSELKQLYGEIKILLTCAPSEGYGLTIREAALSGIQVVARESEGSISAKEQYPAKIHLYDSKSKAVNHIEEILNSEFENFENTSTVQMQKESDHLSIQKWVQTWIP